MGTFTTSGAIVAKAGTNVSTAIPETAFNDWIAEAEATCNIMSRYDYVANSAAITVNNLPILSEIQSALAAIEAVKFDMSGYTSRIEAEDAINVLRDQALRGLSIIRDQKAVKFIRDGA